MKLRGLKMNQIDQVTEVQESNSKRVEIEAVKNKDILDKVKEVLGR